jgi:hypothetical protein
VAQLRANATLNGCDRVSARASRGHARQRLVRTSEQTRSPAVKDQTPDAGVSSAEIEWARRHRLGEAEAAREVGTAGLELAEEDEDRPLSGVRL